MSSRLRLLGAVAVAAAALGAGALLAPAQPGGATPSHVAIVVAGEGSACVPWKPDPNKTWMSGASVLDAAFEVIYGQQPPYQGFVLRIDGRGTDRPDNEHYWSYWKDSGSGWTYSGSGAPWAKASPGTVEGWSYVDGRSSAPPPPAASYASICAGKDPSTAASRPASTTARPARPVPPPASSSAPPPVRAGGDPSHSATVGGAAAGPAPTRHSSASASASASASGPSGVGSTAEASTATSASSMPVPNAADTGSTGGSGLAPWGSAVGIAGVAALAAGAFWFNRRRRQDAP